MPTPGFEPSANVARLRESATIAVSQRAKALRAAGRAILDLGAGEPDFDTPAPIRESAKAAIDGGATRYTATQGTAELRAAIAAKASRRRGETIGPDEIVVSSGSKQSLFNACYCLFGPGDEVLVPTPAWTSYYEMVSLARATPVAVHGSPDHGFRVTPAMIERHATNRTRGLMLNSPVNPTGTVYSGAELRELLALAAARGWWVISDEIYLRIVYGGPAASSLDVAPARERLVVVDGVAKAFAMTGWRIGWSVAPPELTRAMTAFQSHTTFSASAPSQAAALAAVTGGPELDAAVAQMVARFRERRDAAMAILATEPAITLAPPEGAFYLFLRAPGAGRVRDAGTAFASLLLERFDVAVVPGAAFETPDWIRVSYATERAAVEEASRRIVAAYHEASRGL
ncbi:MAG: pyridoxal phosphate-dependent aminotransferase [Gemmatimonadaceae bacterium]|nr:pyridoxal phosphate-dependent aminotransferase [Gemmatimonadaceae bacterium]